MTKAGWPGTPQYILFYDKNKDLNDWCSITRLIPLTLTISFCFSGDISALDPDDTLAPPRAELAASNPVGYKGMY